MFTWSVIVDIFTVYAFKQPIIYSDKIIVAVPVSVQKHDLNKNVAECSFSKGKSKMS